MVFQRVRHSVLIFQVMFGKHDSIKAVSTVRAYPTLGKFAEEGNVLKENYMFEHIITSQLNSLGLVVFT